MRASEVDPWIDVIGPQGQRQLASGVDNTAGRPESVLVPAGTAGRYYLETKSLASVRGSYSLAVADAHAPAVFADEQWRSFSGVSYLRDLALADVTGDGRKDVISAVTDKLMLLPQKTGGGFGDPAWFPIDQGWSYGIGTGDLDGNGSIDVTVASMAGPKIFYAGSGSLSEGPAALPALPAPPGRRRRHERRLRPDVSQRATTARSGSSGTRSPVLCLRRSAPRVSGISP